MPEHSEFKYAATGQVYHSTCTSDGLTLASHFEKPGHFDLSHLEDNGSGNAVLPHQVYCDVDEVFMDAEDNTYSDVEGSLSSGLQKSG